LSKKHGADVAVHLGELEQLVLLALVRLGDDAYGVAVQREIASRAGRHPSFATIYTTLSRLEDKGLIESRLGESSPERGGRRKKYFVMRAAGRRALRASLEAVRGMTRGLDTSFEAP
jgi:DNA-binding PadR family transcriptional regulator